MLTQSSLLNSNELWLLQVFDQEMKETRTRRQVEISEIDNRLVEEYNAKLQLSLQELRDQYEQQMRANRDDIEVLYESKVYIIVISIIEVPLMYSNCISSWK